MISEYEERRLDEKWGPPKKHLCKYCHGEFLTRRKNPITCGNKLCSSARASEYYKAKWASGHPPLHRNCSICGRTFLTKRSRASVCNDEACRKERARLRNAKRTSPAFVRCCLVCGNKFHVRGKSQRLLCGKACQSKRTVVYDERRRNKYIKKGLRPCVRCGTPTRLKLCSPECRALANREQYQKRYKDSPKGLQTKVRWKLRVKSEPDIHRRMIASNKKWRDSNKEKISKKNKERRITDPNFLNRRRLASIKHIANQRARLWALDGIQADLLLAKGLDDESR